MDCVQALWVGLCSDKPVKSDCQMPTQTQVVLDKLDPDQILFAPHFEQILFTAFVYKNRFSAKEKKNFLAEPAFKITHYLHKKP